MKNEKSEIQQYKLEDITKPKLIRFLQDFEEGKAVRYYKSAMAVDDDKLNIKVIIGDDFDRRVIKTNKHVLVQIYISWSKRCSNLETMYRQLASSLIKNQSIVVSRFDLTKNEHPSIIIKSIPTFILYKKGDKSNPIIYEGNFNE